MCITFSCFPPTHIDCIGMCIRKTPKHLLVVIYTAAAATQSSYSEPSFSTVNSIALLFAHTVSNLNVGRRTISNKKQHNVFAGIMQVLRFAVVFNCKVSLCALHCDMVIYGKIQFTTVLGNPIHKYSAMLLVMV